MSTNEKLVIFLRNCGRLYITSCQLGLCEKQAKVKVSIVKALGYVHKMTVHNYMHRMW